MKQIEKKEFGQMIEFLEEEILDEAFFFTSFQWLPWEEAIEFILEATFTVAKNPRRYFWDIWTGKDL